MTSELDITFEFARLRCGSVMREPAAQKAIIYHVRRGSIVIATPGRQAVQLVKGDSVSLPEGVEHSVCCPRRNRRDPLVPIAWSSECGTDADNPEVEAVLFRSTISRSANEYPGLLPALVLIDRTKMADIPWFPALIELFQNTTGMPSRLRVLAQERLASLIARTVDIVGLGEMESMVADTSGSDSRIRKALEKIHQSPEADWSLEELSRLAGASRSAFNAQFKRTVGDTPLRYVTKLRMYKAARLLRTGHSSVSEIAAMMGYATEAAFTKAFSRVVGTPPGRFRKRGE